VILGECRNDERGRLIEVYDDPQPSATVEILPEESNTASCRIVFFKVWTMHGAQKRLNVTKHLRPPS